MLTFPQLRDQNVLRTQREFHPVDDWSPTGWASAAAGELREACNLIKKLRRGEPIPLRDIADEIADTVIYLDLLAARLGIDLDKAITEKFNRTSDNLGSKVKL